MRRLRASAENFGGLRRARRQKSVRKWSASRSMSSPRSRSGGSSSTTTFKRKIQILPKFPRPDHVGQILIRRRDHTHIDRDRLRAADTDHDFFFEHAQQFGLSAGT